MSDYQKLFRSEALAAARDRLGAPVRSAGVANWVLTTFLIAAAASVIVFACLTKYARKETVTGVLAPAEGAIRVSTNRPGVVSGVHVQEGDVVAKGAALITLSSNPTLKDGRRLGDVYAAVADTQQSALLRQAGAKQALTERQRDEIGARRDALLLQEKRLRADIVMQEERVRLTEQTLAASDTLQKQGLMPMLQHRQRQEASLAAKLALSAAQRELEAIPPALAQLAAQDQRLVAEAEDVAASMASSAAELSQRDAANRTDTELVLTAGEGGRVAALQAIQGGAVNAGSTLAVIVPDGVKLQAQLWLPSRAAGFLRRGDRVRLMYDAFPYQRFGVGRGRVADIARAPLSPGELPVALKAEEDLYRVLVELDEQNVGAYGKRWPLTSGMRLQADVILEEQSLWAWLFDKVRAARTRAAPL
ncbi:HlyD family secretion protein [Caulobacter zeae]|nr:HlyD family efflux transporter periplasmic adaptor subunit [Caulobacter zeae]